MIIKLIDDIRKALQYNLYFAALNSALILPDICGKAEFPNETSSRKRYIDWYDEIIGKYEHCQFPDELKKLPYLSGEIIYNLRCSLLHEGNPNIQNDKLKKSLPIDNFYLIIEKEQPFDFYDGEGSSVLQDSSVCIRSYRVNIRRICRTICSASENYYKNNKDKFHFNYKIIDWDKFKETLPKVDTETVLKEMAKD